MIRKFALAALLAAVPLTGVHAQSMPLPRFLTKAAALEKKGALALFSSDMKLLKKEIQNSALLLRQERLAAEKAGRKGAFCPPSGTKVSIAPKELLAHFRGIPAAQREKMQVKDAMRSYMARRFPCRS